MSIVFFVILFTVSLSMLFGFQEAFAGSDFGFVGAFSEYDAFLTGCAFNQCEDLAGTIRYEIVSASGSQVTFTAFEEYFYASGPNTGQKFLEQSVTHTADENIASIHQCKPTFWNHETPGDIICQGNVHMFIGDETISALNQNRDTWKTLQADKPCGVPTSFCPLPNGKHIASLDVVSWYDKMTRIVLQWEQHSFDSNNVEVSTYTFKIKDTNIISSQSIPPIIQNPIVNPFENCLRDEDPNAPNAKTLAEGAPPNVLSGASASASASGDGSGSGETSVRARIGTNLDLWAHTVHCYKNSFVAPSTGEFEIRWDLELDSIHDVVNPNIFMDSGAQAHIVYLVSEKDGDLNNNRIERIFKVEHPEGAFDRFDNKGYSASFEKIYKGLKLGSKTISKVFSTIIDAINFQAGEIRIKETRETILKFDAQEGKTYEWEVYILTSSGVSGKLAFGVVPTKADTFVESKINKVTISPSQTMQVFEKPTITETGTAKISIDNGDLVSISSIDPTHLPNLFRSILVDGVQVSITNESFEHGLFGFVVENFEGNFVDIDIEFPFSIPKGLPYYKFHNEDWIELPPDQVFGNDDNDEFITIRIFDNGIGDSDSRIGIINDPGGPTFPVSNQVVGGKMFPMESTSLILAGALSFSWMIPLVLSVLGIGFVLVKKEMMKRNSNKSILCEDCKRISCVKGCTCDCHIPQSL